MSRLSLVSILILPVFFGGCTQFFSFTKTIPPKQAEKQNPILTKERMIKGFISDLVYSESGWCYTINSIDTSNNKLESGVFCGDSHEFSYGDLVYTIIIDNRIKKMFLLQKEYVKAETKYKKLDSIGLKKPILKRYNKKKITEVPKSEQIRFD
ncbi:hypothetical protein [Campylobacter sp. RM16189]|uniref:hypothetical protein n=1 Tax=Campylobacter sp. RM16189 TaxID=1705726 RepID=UPI0014753E81|nr:hypothetical protein [Campylobacter sp. RM16189]